MDLDTAILITVLVCGIVGIGAFELDRRQRRDRDGH